MLAASLLTASQMIIGLLLYAAALLWALARVPWVELLADSRRQHLLYGSIFFLCVLWLLRRQFDSGLSFHFIGLTVVTLLLNWPLAVVAGSGAQVVLVLLGVDDAQAFGINGLLRVLAPVLVTMLMFRALERLRPTNLFMYIFISGFFAAGLAAVVSILLGMGLLSWSGQMGLPDTPLEFFSYLLLVMFPEGFINGMTIAGLVVFYPDWVDTFDSDRYLQEPFDSDG